jgi:hypothetical protein
VSAVRYVALLALVFWLGVLFSETMWIRPGSLAPFVCGALIMTVLVVQKLIGPPPRAFALRSALVVAMLALAGYDRRAPTPAVPMASVGLGLVLLGWYARE